MRKILTRVFNRKAQADRSSHRVYTIKYEDLCQ